MRAIFKKSWQRAALLDDTHRFSPLLGFGAGMDVFLGKVPVGFV